MAAPGTCCICGIDGPLSFEHVPPRAAFNDKRVFEANMPKLIGAGGNSFENVEGAWAQRGAGKFTLCGSCNSNTGSWYGPAYVAWAYQAACLVAACRGTLSIAYPYHIFPLRVLKQVVVMFFSACGPGLQKKYPDLVRFVLDRKVRYMPYGLRVSAYLVHPTKSVAFRQCGVTGLVNFHRGLTRHIFAEISFAPFGFIMTFDGEPSGVSLCEITQFAENGYDGWGTHFLKFPVLPVVSWLPGDFRTRDELEAALQTREPVGQYFLGDPYARAS
jgi:hypothetical protein